MSCNGHTPKFQPQLGVGDPHGGVNCTAYAAAMAADFDSCGLIVPTGRRVRALSDEPVPDPRSPGLNLAQVDEALCKLGVDLDVRYRYPWAELHRRVTAGQGCILQVRYAPIAATRFDAGRGFRGNHALFVPPGWGAMDPLADGRAPGVYRYHGEAYPEALLREAAGALELGNGHRVGAGYAYAAFTRDQRSTWLWRLFPDPPARRRAFWVYRLDAQGVITGRSVDATRGIARPCTEPRLHRWPGHPSKPLVQLLEGARAGKWVHASHAHEVP